MSSDHKSDRCEAKTVFPKKRCVFAARWRFRHRIRILCELPHLLVSSDHKLDGWVTEKQTAALKIHENSRKNTKHHKKNMTDKEWRKRRNNRIAATRFKNSAKRNEYPVLIKPERYLKGCM